MSKQHSEQSGDKGNESNIVVLIWLIRSLLFHGFDIVILMLIERKAWRFYPKLMPHRNLF